MDLETLPRLGRDVIDEIAVNYGSTTEKIFTQNNHLLHGHEPYQQRSDHLFSHLDHRTVA